MGSLPNLHELGQDGARPRSPYRPGPALGHLCGGPNPTLSPAEKSKILHRYSGHVRITKARSNGHDSKIIYDDFMLEHMAAYSPISTRHLPAIVRRRSSSSLGATSLRRLLGTVRPQRVQRVQGSAPHSRRLLLSNLLVLCLSHMGATSALLPFLALQTSVSAWIPPHVNGGSLLIAGLYACAALAAPLGPPLVQKAGANAVLVGAYAVMGLFYLAHLWPSLYVLGPGAALVGLAVGALYSAQSTFLMTLAAKISYMFSEEDDEAKALRRTCIIRRLARAFQAAHDFGLIVGSVLVALLISYTVNLGQGGEGLGEWIGSTGNGTNRTEEEGVGCGNLTDGGCVSDYNAFLDELFDTYEGARLCGALACPPAPLNQSEGFRILPPTTTTALAIVFAAACLMAAMASAALDRVRMYVYQDPLERPAGLAALRAVGESFRDVRLQMAAPLSLFIGLEQAFMYSDFSKSYVVCTLGIHRLNLVFLSMGLLQSIAACTLSMLLRSIRRYYVVAVGFTFHACLLMVLMLWKPIEDDPALFYVISAAWGVCNAIWEMLNFTLLTGLYADNWEAAFANATFFRCLGLSIAFGYHGLLCNYLKLYTLGFFLLVAVVPFAWLEIRLENMRKIKNIIRL